MKKLWIALLALVLVFSLCACSREFTFEENTSVLGVDVSGCNREDAWTRLEAAVSSYALELTIDEITLQLKGKDIGLGCSKDAFLEAVLAMDDGTNADFSSVVTFDEGKLKDLIAQNFNKELAEATLVFDETANAYQLTPHAEGLHTDPDAVVATIADVVVAGAASADDMVADRSKGKGTAAAAALSGAQSLCQDCPDCKH